MTLAQFIRSNREPILVEWEAFARTCSPASGSMDIEALRDHAGEMLVVIVEDLETPQGKAAQAEKSKGRSDAEADDSTTAAEEHGAGRADSGFTVEQMVAEYRALRASVIRLWTKAEGGELAAEDIEDLTRFNEAIDQSLAESVSRYNQDLEQSKEMFLAILGHDLRTPLAAIYTSAKFMLETDELEEPHRTLTSRIAGSAIRTTHMVGDLLDFTRSRLGDGIPIERAQMDIVKAVRDAIDEISAAHPRCPIEFERRGNQIGNWDYARISQALGNLIGNAVQHGSEGTTVTVEVRGDKDEVSIVIHNRGVPISSEDLNGIFNPMKSQRSARKPLPKGPTGSLGLGLYIAERIVAAHEGRIEVESTEKAGTTFTMYLPRDEKPKTRPKS